MRGLFVVEAQVQAQAMLAVVDREHPGALERLRRDPVAELSGWADIEVSLVEETAGIDRCSVAGSYEPAPPTLVVAESTSRRRRGFTALHELGHHLQQTNLELGDATYQYSDPEQFQEEACDAFAAQVLLPDHDLARRIDPRGPVAQDVVDLFTTYSSASREACCVWAARHLTGVGAVVLLDGAGTVLFAAPHGFIPPARGSDQSSTPLIAAALHSRGRVSGSRSRSHP
jgi:Zn-dependent peptidase ImmA (M78 family)